jgi:hypothetical protein
LAPFLWLAKGMFDKLTTTNSRVGLPPQHSPLA